MNIGYACIACAVEGSELKSCMLKNASEERLLSLIEHNFDALETIIGYNIKNGIKLFRISSELIPFGSSAAATLPWQDIFRKKLLTIGKKIIDAGLRVSMHPGQYTVLNSPDSSVVERAVQDLYYHNKVLDSLGVSSKNKLILHTGGVYGNKSEAKKRFISNYLSLPYEIKSRLVLENDDTMFHIEDVLEISAACGIPIVYDNLHNAVHPSDIKKSDRDWIQLCSATWKENDGIPKIHYAIQNPSKCPGAHSDSIDIQPFLNFYNELSGLDADIMLEVKDKNLSALKCLHCTSDKGMGALETEWARYKFAVLEHSPNVYHAIRELLCDKASYPALEMYDLIETAFKTPVTPGNAINAAQHVWGYFKDRATDAESKQFERLLSNYLLNKGSLQAVKNNLYFLAKKYEVQYLLDGYYFCLYE